MIRNPINVYPYNNIIDAEKINNFSFTFSGDKIKTVFAELYAKNSDSLGNSYYTPVLRSPVTVLDDYVYNGGQVVFNSFTPEASESRQTGIWSNDNSYLWSAYMCSEAIPHKDTSIADWGDYGNYKSYTLSDVQASGVAYLILKKADPETEVSVPSNMFYFNNGIVFLNNQIGLSNNDVVTIGYITRAMEFYTSPQYYFDTFKTPQLIVENVDNDAIILKSGDTEIPVEQGELATIENRTVEIIGNYYQQQLIGLKNYALTLTDSNDNIIIETGQIYSQNIKYTYTGLANNQIYNLKIEINTQKNQSLIFECQIKAEYIENITTALNPIIECNEDETVNIIKWAVDKLSNANVNGVYDLTNNKLNLESGTVSYDKVNSLPIKPDTMSFGVSFKVDVAKENIYQNTDYANMDMLEVDKHTEGKIAQLNYEEDDISCKLVIYCYRGQLKAAGFLNNSATTFRDFSESVLYTFYDNQTYHEEYAIQQNTTINENTVYMWYDNNTNSWSEQTTDYWKSNDTTGKFETLLIVIQDYFNTDFTTASKIE